MTVRSFCPSPIAHPGSRLQPPSLRCFTLVGVAVLFASSMAAAPAAPEPERNSTHSVVVPYDASQPLEGQEARTYYLDYDAFDRLWKAAKDYRRSHHKEADPNDGGKNDFILTNALYRGKLAANRLEIEGRLTLVTRGKAWQKVPLPFASANLSRIELDGNPASYQDGAILVEKPGRHLVTVSFEVPVPENSAAGASWKMPAASASLLALTMDADVIEPVINGGLPLVKSRDSQGQTIFTTALGQASEVEFRRRLKSTGRGMTKPSVAMIQSHLFVTPALERLEASFLLEFAGQEENRFSIAFDESITPIRFDIPNLATWQMVDGEDGLRQLDFELTQPVRDRFTVRMVGERLIESLDGTRNFPSLGAGAIRLEQSRSLLTTSDLELLPSPGPRHRQTDFSGGGIDTAGFRPVGTFGIAGEDEPLEFSLAQKAPERSASAEYVFQVSEGKLETIGQFQIRSPGAPLHDATLQLPADASVQAVEGNRVKDWWRSGDSLFVRFAGETPEITALLVYIATPLDGSSAEADLRPFPLAGFDGDRIKGSGLVVAHVRQDTSLNFDQDRQIVREVGAEEVASDFEVLPPLERKRGFRFDEAEFSGRVNLSEIEPRYDTSWVMLAQAYESWINLSIQVDVEVARSAIDRLSFSTDASTPEFRLLSPEIREVRTTEADGRRDYLVIFQRFVTDAIDFTLATEVPHSGAGSLPDVDFPGATRQERYLIVENQSNDRFDVQPAGLDPTVPELLPFVPETLGSAQLFRARPGWEMTISMEKLETSAGNEAVVLFAELSTAFRANGEEWLKAVYRLQNRSLQFLPVALPENAELVSVMVANSEVRADRGEVEGREVVLVPLIQTKPGQLAYDVSIVVRNRENLSQSDRRLTRLRRNLDDPEIVGLTIERTLWNLYLPNEHRLTDAEGNMDQVEAKANLIEKLQADLSELEQLNALGRSENIDFETLALCVANGDVIVQKIEQIANSNGIAITGKLEGKLNQQKLILNENRIEMPTFATRRASGSAGQRVDLGGEQQAGNEVNWLFNSKKVVTRNTGIREKQTEQRQRLEQQVRLNDNISVGNNWFNPTALAEREEAGLLADEQTNQRGAVAEERFKQINKLASTSDGKAKDVAAKLQELNFSQTGQGGMDDQRENLPQNYIAIPQQQMPVREELEAAGKEKSKAASKPQSKVSQSFFGRNARQSIKSLPEVAATEATLSPGEGTTSNQPAPSTVRDDPVAGRLSADQQQMTQVTSFDANSDIDGGLGEVFRAEGRRAVAVDFPVEGTAYHFQKLKDHAELRIESRKPADLERGKWLAWLIALLAVLGGGEWLWRRRRTAISP